MPHAIQIDVSAFSDFLAAGGRLFVVVTDDPEVARARSSMGSHTPMLDLGKSSKDKRTDIFKHTFEGSIVLYGSLCDVQFLLTVILRGHGNQVLIAQVKVGMAFTLTAKKIEFHIDPS